MNREFSWRICRRGFLFYFTLRVVCGVICSVMVVAVVAEVVLVVYMCVVLQSMCVILQRVRVLSRAERVIPTAFEVPEQKLLF